MSSELKSPDLDGEELSREILACENQVYITFLGPQPDAEAWQKLTLSGPTMTQIIAQQSRRSVHPQITPITQITFLVTVLVFGRAAKERQIVDIQGAAG